MDTSTKPEATRKDTIATHERHGEDKYYMYPPKLQHYKSNMDK